MPEQTESILFDQTHTETNSARDVKYFHTLGSGVLKGVETPAGFPEAVDTHLQTLRQGIIERFPSDLEGLNMDRIDSFFDKRDLRRSPLVVWPYDRQEELTKYITDTIGPFESMERGGVYIAPLDLTVAFRDKALEEANGGPEITESLIVHEQAHGSNAHHITRAVAPEHGTLPNIEVPRHGQATHSHGEKTVGLFLEEAFADYTRGQYLEEIGMKNGVLNLEGRMTTTHDGYDKELPMSLKYAFRLTDGTLTSSPSSHAAMALEMLLEKDPDLWPAMLKGRHDVDGLREVAQRLNAIQPGLYKTLRDNFNGEMVFHEGLGYVVEILKGSGQATSSQATVTPAV
ncbi:hypothetical protein IU459_16135 [Nocardia amamiensis]|uniref:Uncharacterized protein n=1 Tax=Nocardia amamiensis TaxID=404578 RepID=A0ABS0CR17_9NOCA|nr:hypothetical protein [Nocardia amamiensis]MBF6299059.1 hypothetical protein [Nocardia amamiensis]